MQRPRYWENISGPFLGNGSVINIPAARDTNSINELCFLCGPCRDVISNEKGLELSQFCTGVCEEIPLAGSK
jgi:hypothetical protein